ncbi:NUDIX domain-containing protein [Candidatus Pacearchaeota archaeon]|nr:NUDIX domain-containing protein [Candidatus Pacearchaeota archaeon]
MNRNIRVSVILLKDNKLLLVNMRRKNSSIYVLPGGGLELGESIFEAGAREVKEETNLNVKNLKIVYLKELYTHTDESMDIILYGEIASGELKKGYDPEHGDNQKLYDVFWIDIEKLPSLNFHPKQLIIYLKKDLENKFSIGVRHLGRFEYPER